MKNNELNEEQVGTRTGGNMETKAGRQAPPAADAAVSGGNVETKGVSKDQGPETEGRETGKD